MKRGNKMTNKLNESKELKVTVKKENIPIFFSSDDNYVPYLAVAIRSLINNASSNYDYSIYILNNGIKQENINILKKMQTKNINIEFVDVSEKIKPIINMLGLRDYYSVATYFRFFIANMFKNLHKALYLDCDIVVCGDISQLYNHDLGDNILGGCLEQIVAANRYFRKYSQDVIGIDYTDYFNAGILVMNLDAFRKNNIEQKFVSILTKYNFDTIAADQDYLNFLCKNKVTKIDMSWNKECIRDGYNGKLNIIHYAYFKKPWTDYYVKYEKYFWEYAKQTEYYEYLVNYRKNFKMSQRINNAIAAQNLIKRAKKIYNSDFNFHKVFEPENKNSTSEKKFEFDSNNECYFPSMNCALQG